MHTGCARLFCARDAFVVARDGGKCGLCRKHVSTPLSEETSFTKPLPDSNWLIE